MNTIYMNTKKSKKETDIEQKVLLNTYRRQNMILHDRCNHMCDIIIPSKDKVISDLNDKIQAIVKERDEWKAKYNSKSWFSWNSSDPMY